MDKSMMLNQLAISRWAIEYFNLLKRGGIGAGYIISAPDYPSDPSTCSLPTPPQYQLSRAESALYHSALEFLNRFLAGEFDWSASPPPHSLPSPAGQPAGPGGVGWIPESLHGLFGLEVEGPTPPIFPPPPLPPTAPPGNSTGAS